MPRGINPGYQIALVGHTVEIKCSLDGHTKWFWQSSIEEYSASVQQNVKQNVLRIKNISKSDKGSYTCYGVDSITSKKFVSYVFIKVISKLNTHLVYH